jgi:hypothetical protein
VGEEAWQEPPSWQFLEPELAVSQSSLLSLMGRSQVLHLVPESSPSNSWVQAQWPVPPNHPNSRLANPPGRLPELNSYIRSTIKPLKELSLLQWPGISDAWVSPVGDFS